MYPDNENDNSNRIICNLIQKYVKYDNGKENINKMFRVKRSNSSSNRS